APGSFPGRLAVAAGSCTGVSVSSLPATDQAHVPGGPSSLQTVPPMPWWPNLLIPPFPSLNGAIWIGAIARMVDGDDAYASTTPDPFGSRTQAPTRSKTSFHLQAGGASPEAGFFTSSSVTVRVRVPARAAGSSGFAGKAATEAANAN